MEHLKPQDMFVATYGGANIMAAFVIPGEPKPYVFAELQTLSYSIHREKRPVRVLGTPDPIGYTYGPRMIAGSLIFATLDEHMVRRAMRAASKKFPRLVADQLPPFHISISLADELGHRSRIIIYNCSIVDEGQVFSIEQISTETTMSYIASSIDHMRNMDSAGEHTQRHQGLQKVSLPRSVPEVEEATLLGGLIVSNEGLDVSGVKIIAHGPGYTLETYTRPNGTYLLHVPYRAGEIRVEGYRNGYLQHIDTRPEPPMPIPQPRQPLELQPDQRTIQLPGHPIDIHSLRLWVDGNEIVNPSAAYPYSVDEVLGRIYFDNPLPKGVQVEAAWTWYTNISGGEWKEPAVESDHITGRVRYQYGAPASDVVVRIDFRDGTTVYGRTDEDGAFALDHNQKEMVSYCVLVEGKNPYERNIHPNNANRYHLGEIVLPY